VVKPKGWSYYEYVKQEAVPYSSSNTKAYKAVKLKKKKEKRVQAVNYDWD